MLKVIIADDEVVIARGIEKLVSFENFGIEIIGVYNDGLEAFNGIVKHKPDIAILDIQMPKINGISVLRKIKKLNITTKIIFISGFQDFEYARSALHLGAIDYILKPVITEELVKALEKATKQMATNSDKKDILCKDEIDYALLSSDEDTAFAVVVVNLTLEKDEEENTLKLINFSLTSFLNKYMSNEKKGIFFVKNNNKVLVFESKVKNLYNMRDSVEYINNCLIEIKSEAINNLGHGVSFIVSDFLFDMSEIPVQFERCIDKINYLFFADRLYNNTLYIDNEMIVNKVTIEEFDECRRKIIDIIMGISDNNYKKNLSDFSNFVYLRSEGKQENAIFHYCTLLKEIEKKLKDLRIISESTSVDDFFKIGRNCYSYKFLVEKYEELINKYKVVTENFLAKNKNKELLVALDYIDKNFSEKLTLEVLAEIVHMSSFYFSSFFKKQMGVNFKEYLNKVRLEQALKLLLSTNMTSAEIVSKTGFRDVRYYNEVFLKTYGMSPSMYKKQRIKNNEKAT